MENQSSCGLPNLKNNPFGQTADGSYPYSSSSFREALKALYYELECGSRVLMLVAEPGLGKTTLLRHFARRLRGRGRSLFLSTADDPGVEVLRKLAAEIGGTAACDDLLTMQRQVDEMLSSSVDADKPFILLLDTGENCAQSVGQSLRTLTLLDSFERCLLRVVIAGSAELADDLQTSAVAGELRRVPLAPLSAAEVASYIDYRLRLAGWRGAELFTADDCAMIAERSGGKPSAINDICLNLLHQLGEPQSAESTRPPENKAALTEANAIGGRHIGQQVLSAVAEHSPIRRIVALTWVILMLLVAAAGLSYRSTINARAAKHPAAGVTAPHNHELVSVHTAAVATAAVAPSAGIALTGPSPALSGVELQATPAESALLLKLTPAEPAVTRAANEMAADEIRRGDAYMNAGEYDKALDSFSKALVFAPHSTAQEKVERARRAKAAEQNILQ